MKRIKRDAPRIAAKCIMGHSQVLTDSQIKEAQRVGAAFCSECGNAMTVKRASM